MTNYFISLDFDGCVFNAAYLVALKSKPVARANSIIEANKSLINSILSKTEKHTDVVLMVGSNRQSNKLDITNGLKALKSFATEYPDSGSCFSSLVHFCNELNNHLASRSKEEKIERFKIDKFLLADLYNDKSDGYSFDLGLTDTAWNYIDSLEQQNVSQESSQIHPETITDVTKITLLYAQIHKAAASVSQTSNENIIFDFIDDLTTILSQVSDFFKLHRDLLPKNVTLNLIHYPQPAGPVVFATIEGQGNVDFNYRANVIQFAKLGGFEIAKNDLSKAIKMRHIYSIVDEFKNIRQLHKSLIASPEAKKSKKRSIFAATHIEVESEEIITLTLPTLKKVRNK